MKIDESKELTREEVPQAILQWAWDMTIRGYGDVSEDEKTAFRAVMCILQLTIQKELKNDQ